MLLIDDLILAPGKFVFWILRQVHAAAKEEMGHEIERLMAELSELHQRFESGTLSEREFDLRERDILDHLDELKAGGTDSEPMDSEHTA